MQTFSFDSRYKLPNYFRSHIAYALAHSGLNLITPARRLKDGTPLRCLDLHGRLNIINPDYDPCYQATSKIFDRLFVNLSTNPSSFERACFLRWFAFDIASAQLVDDEYLCMLDSDVLLMSSPRVCFDSFASSSANASPDFIGCISDAGEVGVVIPAIIVMKKRILSLFCEFLLSSYFSDANRGNLLTSFYKRVGRGVFGGISDMTAWFDFVSCAGFRVLNMAKSRNPLLIENFNDFLAGPAAHRSCSFVCNDFKAVIDNDGERTPLLAIHFQGDAKPFMSEWPDSGAEKTITSDDLHLLQSKFSPRPLSRWSRIRQKVMSRLDVFFRAGELFL